jgi:NitT/TauT family transport system ATP-binding protein
VTALALNEAGLVYDNGFAALHDISVQFARGSFTALVGPSGCGKSSLLRSLAGLEQPSIGSVTGLAQSDIGFVFQEPTLLAWRSVADNIALPLKIEGHAQSEIEARRDEALQLVGPDRFCQCPAAAIIGRHENARLAGPRLGQAPARLADG